MLDLHGLFVTHYQFVPLNTITLIPHSQPPVTTILSSVFYRVNFVSSANKWYNTVFVFLRQTYSS